MRKKVESLQGTLGLPVVTALCYATADALRDLYRIEQITGGDNHKGSNSSSQL